MKTCRRCGKRHLFNLLWAAIPGTRYTVGQTASFACIAGED